MEEDDAAATLGARGARGEGQPVGVDLEALDHPVVISRARDGAARCLPPGQAVTAGVSGIETRFSPAASLDCASAGESRRLDSGTASTRARWAT